MRSAYSKAGQTEEQQARDRNEGRQWAAKQIGIDPAKAQTDVVRDAAAKRQGYLRAEAACLEGCNYSVK